MRFKLGSTALLLGAMQCAQAFDYNAIAPISGYSGSLPWNYPGSNTDVYLGTGYNTAGYQALYNALSPAPSGFGNANLVGVAPVATPGNVYGIYTVALRGSGVYSFKILQPGTTATQNPTSYDLMSILYVSPTSKTPFNASTPYANLVALNDDALAFSANPTPLYYINTSSTACVTMSLVYFSWAGVPNAFANIQASGLGQIASNCDALGVLNSVTTVNNSAAVGAATVIDAHPALVQLFNSLSTDQQKSNAVSQTLPLLTGSSMLAANAAFNGINRVIQARIEGNRGLSSGDTFEGDRHLWFKPFGSWAGQSDRDGVSGFKASTYGGAVGIDGTASGRLRLGAAFAYANSSVDSNSNVAPQSATVNVYQLIGYGTYSLNETMDINFQVDVGQNKNNGRRVITFTDSIASAKYSSDTAHVGIGLGKLYKLSSRTTLTPSVRADYTWVRDDGYTESGADLLNLTVDSRKAEQLIFGVDGKLTHALTDVVTLLANAGVGYDTMSKQASITAAYAGAPGAAFVTYGLNPSPWLGRGGIGLLVKKRDDLEITGRYDVEFREAFLNQTASVKLRWLF